MEVNSFFLQTFANPLFKIDVPSTLSIRKVFLSLVTELVWQRASGNVPNLKRKMQFNFLPLT
mgnify:CR=1 FL=1